MDSSVKAVGVSVLNIKPDLLRIINTFFCFLVEKCQFVPDKEPEDHCIKMSTTVVRRSTHSNANDVKFEALWFTPNKHMPDQVQTSFSDYFPKNSRETQFEFHVFIWLDLSNGEFEVSFNHGEKMKKFEQVVYGNSPLYVLRTELDWENLYADESIKSYFGNKKTIGDQFDNAGSSGAAGGH